MRIWKRKNEVKKKRQRGKELIEKIWREIDNGDCNMNEYKDIVKKRLWREIVKKKEEREDLDMEIGGKMI